MKPFGRYAMSPIRGRDSIPPIGDSIGRSTGNSPKLFTVQDYLLADVAIRAPATRTDRVQEAHICLYHCLCEMLEIRFFQFDRP